MITKSQKAEWIKALRGKKYTQTIGCLRDIHGFCCLGVLCDVLDDSKWTKTIYDNYKYNRALSYLPSHIKIPRNQQKELAIMNDDSGCDFNDIADWVEENIETID